MTSKFKSNRGISRPIKWGGLEKGLVFVLDNAERLNRDANLLLKAKRYPSSRFLCLLAKEEIGKVFLIADKWVGKQSISPKDYRDIFSSGEAHQRKLAAAGRIFLRTEAWQNMPGFFAEHDQESKERSLYVDYQESGKFGYWATPLRDLNEDGKIMKSMGMDTKGMKQRLEDMDELELSYQIKRNYSAITSLRGFVKLQREALPENRPARQPVIVAPARQPPEIRVTKEFTVAQLLEFHDDWIQMLQAPESAFYPTMSTDKLRKDVESIPSQTGKLAYLLYHLGLLRNNVFIQYHNAAQTLGEFESKNNDAIELMNSCATRVLIPFAGRRQRLRTAIETAKSLGNESRKPLPYFPDQWRRRFKKWKVTSEKVDPRKRLRDYLDLNYTFSMLHFASYSDSNFPKLNELTESELNRFLVTGHFP